MKGPKISNLKYSLPHHNLLKNIPRFVFSSLYVCCTDGIKRWKKLWKVQWVQRKRSQRKEWHRNLETEVIRIFERQRRELGTVPLNNVAFALRKMSKNFLVFVCALQCNSLFCYFLKISFNNNHDSSEAPEARFVFPLDVSLCLPVGTQKVPCPQSILHPPHKSPPNFHNWKFTQRGISVQGRFYGRFHSGEPGDGPSHHG